MLSSGGSGTWRRRIVADITMCPNRMCTRKKDCYRYEAVPAPHRQSYGIFIQFTNGQCGGFIPLDEKKDVDKVDLQR